MLTVLERARKRGCQILSFNPLREKGLESFVNPQHILQTRTRRAVSHASVQLFPREAAGSADCPGQSIEQAFGTKSADIPAVNRPREDGENTRRQYTVEAVPRADVG